MCDAWLDRLSWGSPSSSPGPDGLFDFFCLSYSIKKSLFCSWNSQRGKATLGELTSPQEGNKTRRFVSELMLATPHRSRVGRFLVLL